jgi:hypothetical protein
MADPTDPTDLTTTPDCNIELMRYLLTEMEAGRFDYDEDNLSACYDSLMHIGCVLGIPPPD